MNWYYAINGAQQGPIEEDELRKLVRQGVITADTLVWHEGLPTWQPLSVAVPGMCPSPPPVGADASCGWPDELKGPGVAFSALKARAQSGPKGNYWTFAGYLVLSFIINVATAFIPVVGQIVGWVIGGPLLLGQFNLALRGAEHKKLEIGDGFVGFNQFGRAFVWMLLSGLYLFLWSLLFIIPGIIKSFSYAMTPFILLDHPEMGVNDAITASRRMMDGHKWEFFCLNLSFIGWWLLNILTLGILTFWIVPYQNITMASFYRSLASVSTEKALPPAA